MSSQDTKQPEPSVPVEEAKVDASQPEKVEEVEAVIAIFYFLKLKNMICVFSLQIPSLR